MPKISHVNLLKTIKFHLAGKWTLARALFDSKGRVRRDRVTVADRTKSTPKVATSSNGGKAASAIAKPLAPMPDAAEKARVKQAELDAVRNGIVPAPPVVEVCQERTTLTAALDAYKDYVQLSPQPANLPYLPSHPRFFQARSVARSMSMRWSARIFSILPPTA